jgi:hypothetical protein
VLLAFFCLGPGAAIAALLKPRMSIWDLGLIIGLSLSVLTLIGVVILAADAWDPVVATCVTAGVCVPVLVWGLLTSIDAPPFRDALPVRSDQRKRLLALALLAGGVALWIVALHHVNLAKISGYGLLTALPVTYYLALGLIAAGFVIAISDWAPSPALLALQTVALVLVLHATTAILYPEPRYTHTYKYLGVIDYIRVHGAVDRHVDVYQNWPGFFTLNAWLERAGGIRPISYAAWAQTFFELFSLAAVLFAVRGLTRDVRLQWAAVWLFLVGDWIGQNYLAPQAISFPLVVLVLGLLLRCAPARAAPWAGFGRRVRLWVSRAAGSALVDAGTPDGLLPKSAALACGALLFGTVVVTHQLSPVLLILCAFFFAGFTGRLPLRVVGAMVAVELLWAIPAAPFLGKRFNLFSFDLTPNARPSGENFGRALPGAELVAVMAKAVVIGVALLAIAGIVRQRRAGRVTIAPIAFAVAPVVAIPFQTYGGEIIYRAYLFALPWLAYYAAVACTSTRQGGTLGLVRAWRLAAATAAVGTALLFAYFGLEKINYVTGDDIAAVAWYENHAPNASMMAYAAPGLPDRLNANYARLRLLGDQYVPVLSDMPVLRRHLATARDVPAIVAFLRGARAPHTYLSVTPSEANFSSLYGIMPPNALGQLARVLQNSTEFELVYRHGRASVFELKPAAPGGSGRFSRTSAGGSPSPAGAQ